MKKIFSALVFVICAGILNFCSADLKDYYDNDSNYKCVGGRMGYYIYVYLPSVHVQEYNPPHYQIGFNMISIVADVYKNGTTESTKWHYNEVKRYNWYTKESFHLENGYWQKDDTAGNITRNYEARYFADVVFRAAYGMDFYGY